MKTYQSRVILLLSSLWICSGSVNAATINQLASFSLIASGPANSAALDIIGLDPFDTRLGTLDEVRVSIDGSVRHTGSVFGVIPYKVDVALNFTGLLGKFFNFGSSSLELTHQGSFPYVSCSNQGCVPIPGGFFVPTAEFELDFNFNRDFQELTGVNQGLLTNFAVGGVSAANPPVFFNGAVSDFEESLFNVNQMDVLMLRTVTGNFLNLTTNVFGSLSIDYDFTPNPVPIPAAVWLFGTAIIGLAGTLRRGRKRA